MGLRTIGLAQTKVYATSELVSFTGLRITARTLTEKSMRRHFAVAVTSFDWIPCGVTRRISKVVPGAGAEATLILA